MYNSRSFHLQIVDAKLKLRIVKLRPAANLAYEARLAKTSMHNIFTQGLMTQTEVLTGNMEVRIAIGQEGRVLPNAFHFAIFDSEHYQVNPHGKMYFMQILNFQGSFASNSMEMLNSDVETVRLSNAQGE